MQPRASIVRCLGVSFLSAALSCSSGCRRESPVPSATDPDYVRPELIELLNNLATGPSGKALNCNRVTDGTVAKLTRCVQQAVADHEAFFVRYSVQGIDSFGYRGLAGDGGVSVWAVDYDTGGWMAKGLPRDSRLLDRNHIVIYPCAKPLALREDRLGYLSCVTVPE